MDFFYDYLDVTSFTLVIVNCHVGPELLWILKSLATFGALVR
jgi:hypothetical protein